MKNNLKEMAHNPKSGNSDKYDERDCCTECKEHCCVIKQEWSWINCSVCEKLLHQNFTIFSETCIEYGSNNHSKYLEKRTKGTRSKKSHSDTEYRLFYLITILICINLLLFIS